MKRKPYIWIALIAFAVAAGAATLTITIPPNDVLRVSKAYGKLLQLVDANGAPRDATMQEVQNAVRDGIIANVYGFEAKTNSISFSPTPLEMQPTPTPTPTATPTATGTPTP